MTEKEKMIQGLFYDACDPELLRMRLECRVLLKQFNDADPADFATRAVILAELFGAQGNGVHIEPPFYCDYGSNVFLGDGVYMNFNCVILDPAPVVIEKKVMFGPSVQVYTAAHPVQAAERIKGPEFGAPVTIRENAWIGGAAVIRPGVTVGRNAVIAAGAVVIRDVPDNTVVGGNPAKVIKKL